MDNNAQQTGDIQEKIRVDIEPEHYPEWVKQVLSKELAKRDEAKDKEWADWIRQFFCECGLTDSGAYCILPESLKARSDKPVAKTPDVREALADWYIIHFKKVD